MCSHRRAAADEAVHPALRRAAGEAQCTRGGKPERPDGLTGRELDVLGLIAAGKSNRQIADTLVISENTVFHHVGKIFSKTGCKSRSEAAIYAERRGLATG